MADNLTLNAGSGGSDIHTDELAGAIHVQRIKVGFGVDGSYGDVTTSNPLPVDLRTDNLSGNLDVNIAATAATLTVAGVAAENAAVSGNPLLAGGRYDATPRTLGDGDVGALALDADGALHVSDGGNTLSVDWGGTAPPIGAGVEATALRVTLATDSTGVVSVDDNGASLSIDIGGTAPTTGAGATDAGTLRVTLGSLDTLTVGNGGTFVVQEDGAALTALQLIDDGVFIDSTSAHTTGDTKGYGLMAVATPTSGSVSANEFGHLAMSLDRRLHVDAALSANSGVDIGDVDVLTCGAISPGTSAGNLGKAVDNAAGATDIGVAMLAVRDDALTTLTPIDGDYTHLRVSSTGALHVTGAGGGTQYNVDDAAGGTDTGTLLLAVRDDALTTLTPADGDYTPFRVNSTGALHVTGAGGGTQYNIDDASGGTDTGTLLLAIRDDSLTTLTPADGDYTGLRVSSTGALHVTGGGGGTEYSEDAATPSTIVGTATMMERDDALSTLTPIQGDWAAMRCDATGALWVKDPDSVNMLAHLASLAGTVAGSELQVDVAGPLPAGTNAIGKLAANSGVDIGDVDILSVPAPLNVTGGGTEAAALRVTLANDSTGVITVDGTVDLGATDNAVLDTIASNTGTIAGAVSGSEMQVDIVAALPAGTNAIGKLAANSGVDIGDVDVTSISAGSNLIGDVGLSGSRTSGGTTLYKNIDVDESEDQVKGSAGQVYWIHAMNLSAAVKYLKLYNATAASVTVGTTVPDLTFPIPTQGDTNGAGFAIAIPNGIAFGTAITVAATTGVADNDSGAPGANEVVVNMGYA